MSDLVVTATVVNINGRNMIKTSHGPYLLGYDYNVQQAQRRVENAGLDWSTVEIKERDPVRT